MASKHMIVLMFMCFIGMSAIGCVDLDVRERAGLERKWKEWVRKEKTSTAMQSFPRPEYPNNMPSLMGVSDSNSPNEILHEWLQSAFVFDKSFVKKEIDQKTIDKLRNEYVFDSTPFVLDETLIQAVKDATKLKWLRIGRWATAEDIKWIAELKQLRGLSLRGATLVDADFGLLANLQELRWLNLRYVDFPPANKVRLPNLPKLEVLFVARRNVKGSHLLELGEYPNLKVFSASFSEFSDDDLRKLVQSNPKLRFLELIHCPRITRDSVPELSKLQQLRCLDIGLSTIAGQVYNRKYDAAPELHIKLPKCFIYIGS